MTNLIDKAVLAGCGIIEKSSSGNFNEAEDSSPTGYFIRTDDVSFIVETNQIQARIGTVFGIKYKLISTLENEIVDFKCTIIHPELTNPMNGETFSETTEYKSGYTNEEHFDFYEFEAEWEIKSGKWRFQVVENDMILIDHEFEVSANV